MSNIKILGQNSIAWDAAGIAEKVFEDQDWTWHNNETPPTRDEIFKKILGLIDSIVESDDETWSISTGRISVEKEFDEGEVYGVRVLLELANIY